MRAHVGVTAFWQADNFAGPTTTGRPHFSGFGSNGTKNRDLSGIEVVFCLA